MGKALNRGSETFSVTCGKQSYHGRLSTTFRRKSRSPNQASCCSLPDSSPPPISHTLALGLLQFPEYFMHFPTWEPLHILVPLPKLPLSSIFPWPTRPQASEISSLHQPIKEDYSFFTLNLPVLFLPSAELIYWISILHQTLCFLQGRIMSVLLTNVHLENLKSEKCSIHMNR